MLPSPYTSDLFLNIISLIRTADADYSAEVAPPEVRGSLVALQQLAITFGIMVSFWIDYGTNFIGGSGDTQSEAAWRIPIALQLVPAIILGVGVLFMPFSPVRRPYLLRDLLRSQ